jgi:hypothetical protein
MFTGYTECNGAEIGPFADAAGIPLVDTLKIE